MQRYDTKSTNDGLPPGEGMFLACSFWLADAYHLIGRDADAKALFERLMSLCNDVGLLSEEYDVGSRRLVGNFPQAFPHRAGQYRAQPRPSRQALGNAGRQEGGAEQEC